jgi:glycosyltransferase involved in cell wall biosynthesis
LEKQKVVIVSYSYPPSNAPAAQRPYAIAKYLDKQKYEVTVLTCANQDSSMGLEKETNVDLEGVRLLKIKALSLKGARQTKAATMKGNKTSGGITGQLKQLIFKVVSLFLFPDKGVTWFPFVWWYVLRNRRELDADIVFSTSPLFTNHLIARLICTKKQRHIVDLRDFHALFNDAHNSGIKGWLHKQMEKHMLKKAAVVTLISKAMKDCYAKAYPKYAVKMHAIYNGFDPDEFALATPIAPNKKLTFFYAGSFYGGLRSPKPLLLTLEQLVESESINLDEFCVEIAGNIEERLLTEIGQLKVAKSIHFLGLMPRKEVLQKYLNSHVLWSIVSNKINHYTGVPIKFYEYLGSRRPILNYAKEDSETAQMIEQLDCGWSLPNTETLTEKHLEVIREIFTRYRNGNLNEPLKAQAFKAYHRSHQTQQLQELF